MYADIYITELIGSGFLAVMAKPVAGEFVAESFQALLEVGVRQVVSLLEESESIEVGLWQEERYVVQAGMTFQRYPIPDRGVPRSVSEFKALTSRLYSEIAGGLSTVIHCRAGIGRSGLVAAGVLLQCGFEPADAFGHVSKARRVVVPDTQEQIDWLNQHYARLVSASA